jgi:hypothetical protein
MEGEPVIFFDMDGVLCNFIDPAAALHGLDPRVLDWRAGHGLSLGDATSRVFGLTLAEFWRPIHDAGAGFWSGLELTAWAADLVALGLKLDDCLVATRPSSRGSSAAGKADWLAAHFGGRFAMPTGAVMTAQKDLLAAPGRVLVDDDDRNVSAWRAAGGAAVLVPQPWNSAGDPYYAADPAAVFRLVRDQLLDLYSGGRG